MKNIIGILFAVLLCAVGAAAQTTTPATSAAAKTTNTETAAKKRAPVFRATKDQVAQAQNKLKEMKMSAGEASGKLDDETRAGLKQFQDAQKIRATGTLNRITLEKMSITLTDKQKEIPVSEISMTPIAAKTAGDKPVRKAPFRADKDQVMQAQKMLKSKTFYSGAETGKLDDATRGGLKKFQTAEKIKATGTLNRETLEKMGIALTDKQKAM